MENIPADAHSHDNLAGDHTHDGFGPGHAHSHLPPQSPEAQRDWHSQDYVDGLVVAEAANDEARRGLLRRVANFIPFSHDTEIRVLDIGAGYGVLAQEVLELFPKSVAVCHDFSEPMLGHARQRLAWAGERVTFVKSDLSSPDWAQDLLQEPFDSVISSMSISSLRESARIKAIYQELFPLVWLRGAFVNCDLVAPAGPATTQAFQRDRALLESGERAAAAARGPRPPANREAEPATLENQLRWLHEAGFKEVDCLLRERQNAVIAGFRA